MTTIFRYLYGIRIVYGDCIIFFAERLTPNRRKSRDMFPAVFLLYPSRFERMDTSLEVS